VILPEICDDGNLLKCKSDCTGARPGYVCSGGNPTTASTCIPICGDGIILSPESCDDNDVDNGDGCSSACAIESGFQCLNNAPPSVCSPICGDGKVMVGEVCDDGDVSDSSGCLGTC